MRDISIRVSLAVGSVLCIGLFAPAVGQAQKAEALAAVLTVAAVLR